MIAHVLKGKYRVFETVGNQNSQVGVPLTLDRLTSRDQIGVLEMGMSEPGQITILGDIIRAKRCGSHKCWCLPHRADGKPGQYLPGKTGYPERSA